MSLVLWLPLDGRTVNCGTGQNEMSGSPNAWTSISAKFAGSTANCIYDDSAKNLYFTNDFTYCAWINQNFTGTTAQWAMTVGRADYATYGYGINPTSATSINLWYGNASAQVTCPKGEWHHLAVSVRNKIGTVYVDGKATGQTIKPSTTATYEDASGIGIGTFHYNNGNNIYPYYGEIRDVRIYDEPLGAKEIHEVSKGMMLHLPLSNPNGGGCKNYFHATGGVQNYYSGTVTKEGNQYKIVSPAKSNAWGNGFSFVSGQLTVPANTWYTISMDALCPTQHRINVDVNNSMDGSSSNDNDQRNYYVSRNFTLPANTWTKVSWSSLGNASKPIGVYDGVGLVTTDDTDSTTWYVKNIQMELNQQPSEYSLPVDLANDATAIPDTSGFMHNGKITGTLTPSADTSRYNSCLASTEDTAAGKGNHFITVNTGFGSMSQFSITGWVKQTDGGGYSTIISNSRSLGGSGLWLAVNTEGHGLWAYDGAYLKYSDNTLLTKGTWYFFAYTYDKGKVMMYRNGIPVSTLTDWTGQHTAVDLNNIYIFDPYSGTGWDTHFVGSLSDIRLYGSVLSESDILNMFQAPVSVLNAGALMTQGEVVE